MPCPVCQSPSRDAIERDVEASVPLATIAKAYGIHHLVIYKHGQSHGRCAIPAAYDPVISGADSQIANSARVGRSGETLPANRGLIICERSREVTENPFSQFKQAWYLTKDDPGLRGKMVSWLQEQLSGEEEWVP